jgi:1-phosphatidylinositol phosphodiesterase
LFFVLTSFLTLSLSPLHAGNGVEWMKEVTDTTRVCRLSIPGSHDSGAVRGGQVLQTQTLDICRQLELGIRAFDIRLAERKGKLGVFHSRAFQRVYWEDEVLPAFIAFLKKHPSEMLVVSLKREGGKAERYTSLLSASLGDPANTPYFVTDFSPSLTLGACRGKILFLQRDAVMPHYPGVLCTGWADNASCLLTLTAANGVQGEALLQDEYEYKSLKEAPGKLQACMAHFDKLSAEPESSCRWGISYVSATAGVAGTPTAFAEKLNRWVADKLTVAARRRCGIVFIDFVGSESGRKLVSHLINNNLNLDIS